MTAQSTSGPTHRAIESIVTLVIAVFGAIVVYGSVKAGIGWSAEGPRAGFFPFYVGLFILLASGINLLNTIRENGDERFAAWIQLRHVFSVIIPTAIYVGSMPFIGIYVGSFLFIGWFMRRLGNYRWLTVIGVAIGMPLVTYVVFERWFLVPLPKGPLEEWLEL